MSDSTPSRQGFALRVLFMLLLASGLLASVAACGKKPSTVDPPLGVEDDQYPRVYPDPATDPKP